MYYKNEAVLHCAVSMGNQQIGRIYIMPIWLKAAGKWGSVFAILALIITLLKQIIAFIGFLTTAIKLFVVLAFVALFLAVGLMVVRTWSQNRKAKE